MEDTSIATATIHLKNHFNHDKITEDFDSKVIHQRLTSRKSVFQSCLLQRETVVSKIALSGRESFFYEISNENKMHVDTE